MASLAALALLMFAACAQPDSDADQRANQSANGSTDPWLAGAPADAAWLPVLATRDLAVGVARVAFTLQGGDRDAPPPRVRADLYDLAADRERPVASQYARFVEFVSTDGAAAQPTPFQPHGHEGGFSVSDELPAVGRGVYIVPVRLPRSGEWGIAFDIDDGEQRAQLRFRFSVRERPAAPAKGDPAPASPTRSLADAPLAQLSSDLNPEPALYQLSLADALALRRPLLLVFATPAFCHSRACAPVLEVVKTVWRARAAELIALHIEVFENPHQPDQLREAPAFIEWNLPSEPWIFVIDHQSRIYTAYEGAAAEAELTQDIDEALALWRAQTN